MAIKGFIDEVRAAVLNADETRYRISKATDISEGNLSRFVHGQAGLSMESLDRLCAYLELRVVGPTKQKGK
jgi:hypothetical protein